MAIAARRIEAGSEARRSFPAIVEKLFDVDPSGLDAKVAALEHTMLRAPKDAARKIVEELGASVVEPAWRDVLITASENLLIEDEKLRASLADSLLRHARRLLAEGEPPILWSALRRYASLVREVEVLENVRIFIEPPRAIQTKQVALQVLQNLFEQSPPSSVPASIEDGIGAIAAVVLQSDDAKDRALLMNAILASACLELPIAVELTRTVKSSGGPMPRLLQRELLRLKDSRGTRAGMIDICLQVLASPGAQ